MLLLRFRANLGQDSLYSAAEKVVAQQEAEAAIQAALPTPMLNISDYQ